MPPGPYNNPVKSFHRIVSTLTNQMIDDMTEEEKLQYIYDRLYDEIARDVINREISIPELGGVAHVPGRDTTEPRGTTETAGGTEKEGE